MERVAGVMGRPARSLGPGWVVVWFLVSGAAAAADIDEGPTDPLQQGIALYASGDYQGALGLLLAARGADPGNASAALFLALAYLRLDHPAEAAQPMAEYTSLAGDPRVAEQVKQYRTVVLQEANRRAARDAVAREHELVAERSDPRALAVAPFRNTGRREYDPLGKAFAAMLIYNVSGLPGVSVLERDRVQALLAETNLSQTGLAEPSTAARAGKLLRAGRVVSGSYTDWEATPTHLRLEGSLYDTEDPSAQVTYSAEWELSQFHELVPAVAETLKPALVAPTAGLSADQQVRLQETHTGSFDAALSFGRGLDLKEAGDFAAARVALEEALRLDPGFFLARLELALLPAAAMTISTVVSALESSASSEMAAATVGTAGGTVGTGAVATTSTASVVGGGIAAAVGLGVGVAEGTGDTTHEEIPISPSE